MSDIVIIKDIKCFNLKRTLECGQCFRWTFEEETSWYTGVILDRIVSLKQQDNDLYIKSNDMNNIEVVISNYLDLKTDCISIENKLAVLDEYIKSILPKTTGMRILKQDMYEMLISYIISANNNIPRISGSIRKISQNYGTRVIFEGVEYYLFPTPEQMKNVTEEDLLACSVGFRARYIKRAIHGILEGTIELERYKLLTTKEAKSELLKILGVGPKVADCILLFGCSRYESFPIDVWVKRVVEKIYFSRDVRLKEIEEFAINKFGDIAGIAQQHLFYSIRNTK